MKRKSWLLLAIFVVILSWAFYMYTYSKFYLFNQYWFMSVTMMFGSFIAGATSEGGGAVAFPVMTLLFKLLPTTARDFSLMIQSFGMLMAAFTIYIFRIRVIRQVIIWASLGGAVGIILSLKYLSGVFHPAFTKMFFTSFWLSFGAALLVINKRRDQQVFEEIKAFSKIQFFTIGLLGGVISGLVGTGIDILTFSYLTLALGVCVKVATPTSVVLMGINSLIGFLFKSNFIEGGMAQDAWNYLLVSIPIVIIGAPFGSVFISNKSKDFIQKLLLVSIVIQFLSSLIIIKQTVTLLLFSFLVIVFGGLVFFMMSRKQKSES
jgi:uncharacterized membrane protein YfcA